MKIDPAHLVFLTRNSEYHTHLGTCLAVRDRRTGAYYTEHPALGQSLEGTFVDDSGMAFITRTPQPGESLIFVLPSEELTTSPILSVERRRPEHLHSDFRTLMALCQPDFKAAAG